MNETTYALVDPSGTVINTIIWDGSTPYQPGEGCTLVLVPDGAAVSIGWTYSGGTFVAPPAPPPRVLTPDEVFASNAVKRNQLLGAAAMAIGPLQNAVDLGMPAAEDTAMLTAWKEFSVAVNRIDLTQTNPPWPGAPQAGFGAAMAP